MKKILIMGLPGSGKTTLASELVPLLNAKWLNNDKVRKAAKDWDFSEEGRVRQAKRCRKLNARPKRSHKERHEYDYYILIACGILFDLHLSRYKN